MTMSPRQRRRVKKTGAGVAAVAALAALVGWRVLWIPVHPVQLSVIAVQPRPAAAATVTADTTAELSQIESSHADLLVTEIAGPNVAAPLLDTHLSCPAGSNQLVCDEDTMSADKAATGALATVVAKPAPADLDMYTAFTQTAGVLAEHPGRRYSGVNLWVNTDASQIAPTDLTGLSPTSDLAGIARQAVTTGAFPGPGGCAGWQVHMVVPSSTNPGHDQAVRQLLSTLISGCGGTLASWTDRWLMPNAGPLALPPIPGLEPPTPAKPDSYTLPDTLFAVGSATLTPAADTALEELASQLQLARPGDTVVCHGTTDGTGSAAYDQTLSTQRAQAVCGYLHAQGVTRVDPVGTGKAIPSGDDPALRSVTISVQP